MTLELYIRTTMPTWSVSCKASATGPDPLPGLEQFLLMRRPASLVVNGVVGFRLEALSLEHVEYELSLAIQVGEAIGGC
jgi:hypothetical protein